MYRKRLVGGSAALAALALVLGSGPALADEPLPQSLAQAVAMDAKDALPLSEFHDPANPLPAAAMTAHGR